MGDWYLSFSHPQNITVGACEMIIATFVAPITTEIGELSGNPRDYYGRGVTISGERDGLKLALFASQQLFAADDPNPLVSSVYVSVTAPYEQKLATWSALTSAFANIGCTDYTMLAGAAAIIDDADAEGDKTTAARLRAETHKSLTAHARICAHVNIRSPRIDIEPILAAYDRVSSIVSVGLSDCRLHALPKNLARFPNIETLSLENEDALDGSALRGFSQPKLQWLTLTGRGLRRIAKDDVAGFPSLEGLTCIGSNLEDLDPDIIAVCPKLIRVYVENTPLAANATKMANLRARWPRMLWSYHEGYSRDGTKVEASTPPPTRVDPEPNALVVPPVTFENNMLTFGSARFSAAHIQELIETGNYRDTVELRVNHTNISDEIVSLIATSGAFPALVELNLSGSGITDAGVLSLATTAVALEHLACVHLGEGKRDQLAVGDAAVDELARSPRLPALRKITRGIEHHVYSEGSRDDTEVIKIVREDGQVIESVVDHSIWP